MNSWFFASKEDRGDSDIDKLWEIFERAIILAESDDQANKAAFIRAYDDAIQAKNVSWNLTMDFSGSGPGASPRWMRNRENILTTKSSEFRFPRRFPTGRGIWK